MAEDERTNGRGLDGFPLDMQNCHELRLRSVRTKKEGADTHELTHTMCMR